MLPPPVPFPPFICHRKLVPKNKIAVDKRGLRFYY